MIRDKKAFTKGVVMSIIFFAVLGYMFSPSFDGGNAFDASDRLFNSIAKGSTYYIPRIKEEAEPFKDFAFAVSIAMPDKQTTSDAKAVLEAAGIEVTGSNGKLAIKGRLGQIVDAALKDADAMFYNKGEEVQARYGIAEKQVLFVWWHAIKETSKDLTRQKGKENFKAAAFLDELNERGTEVGYNFYKIEPEQASSKALVLTFVLVFYVLYTLWWGFAVFFITEGFGLELSSGSKSEH
ncbi:MAG: hypothetical protein GY762_10380 [Proteobacteria bacterium]|nr:hypothetical protein [Pseudomonadota bacterium]